MHMHIKDKMADNNKNAIKSRQYICLRLYHILGHKLRSQYYISITLLYHIILYIYIYIYIYVERVRERIKVNEGRKNKNKNT